MKLHRAATLVAVALVTTGTVGGCGFFGEQADHSPIVIGADLELTGADSAIGTTYQRALQLKVDEVNADGGIDGRPIHLDIRDNKTDPQVSASNIDAFADENVAAIVTGVCSECLVNDAKAIQSRQIPTVALSAANSVTEPVADRQYVFKIGPNVRLDAAALADELRNNDVHRFTVLASDGLDGNDAVDALDAQASVIDATALPAQRIKDDKDVNRAVNDALDHRNDALVVAALPAQADAVATAARDHGFKGHIFFTSTAGGNLFASGSSAAGLENVEMVAPQALVVDDIIATTPGKTTRKRWFDDYTSKYGNFSGYSAYAGDAISLITYAIQSARGTNHETMRALMEYAQFEGLSGQLRFNGGNHSGLMPQSLTMVVVRNGRWRLLG